MEEDDVDNYSSDEDFDKPVIATESTQNSKQSSKNPRNKPNTNSKSQRGTKNVRSKSSAKQLGTPIRFSICAHPPTFAVEYRVRSEGPLIRSRLHITGSMVCLWLLVFACALMEVLNGHSHILSRLREISCTMSGCLTHSCCRSRKSCSRNSNRK